MKSKSVLLNGQSLKIATVKKLAAENKLQIKLEDKALNSVELGYNFLHETVSKNNKIIYGINTGFGPMCNYILAHDQILDLQKNLILSHAVGMGEKIKDEFVLVTMLIRLNMLSKGSSGASPELLHQLEQFINLRIIPIVPEHGAVGTSGDLVQLAHIALALMGKGQVSFKNEIQSAAKVLKELKIKPYKLKPKEGLALINGTSIMAGIACLTCNDASNLLSLAVRNGSLALELVQAYDDSFGEELQKVRPHFGQMEIAKNIRNLLSDSKLIRNRSNLDKNANHDHEVHLITESVQEVYSLRCLAQILGPTYETLSKAWQTTEIEINSVTDNPVVDWKNKKFLHGGNFHGEYIAVAMDQLKMSLVKLTMLSERRLNFFLNNKINGLFPPFLNLDTPGLTLGLQGLQFVATSTTAHSQTLGYPMNLHSISTNGDNQDVVSMGTDAALLTNKVAENAYIVLAIESLALCQAVDFLKVKDKLSKQSLNLYNFVRSNVKKITEDRHLQPELEKLLKNLKKWPGLESLQNF